MGKRSLRPGHDGAEGLAGGRDTVMAMSVPGRVPAPPGPDARMADGDRHPPRARPGRPAAADPGGADTRAELLAAARVEFAERGYEGATVRRIAERAGVDAAMVNHWFGGKEGLFTASMAIPVSPAQISAEVVPGDPDQLGERIVERFLTVWDSTGGGPMAALIQSVAGHEEGARMLREFIIERRGRADRRRAWPRTGSGCGPRWSAASWSAWAWCGTC